ncbi:MAG: hypothetical protein Q4Q04_00435 [Methanocorpusculum sp.]|nr:hypothetical protein [Methanocorpusculum sp.]
MTPDFREESCTYLMLRLKVALKKTTAPFSFLGTSTQVKTVEGAFPQTGYGVTVEKQEEKDTFLITLTPSKNRTIHDTQ